MIDNEIAYWKQLLGNMAVKDNAWKKIPASQGRLHAMAKVLSRGDLQPHECLTAIKNLSEVEKRDLDNFQKELKG